MTRAYMAGVLAGAALFCAAYPAVAQDEGKTAATELAGASKAALPQL
jgi:hypothetical protein